MELRHTCLLKVGAIKEVQARESQLEFISARKQFPAVESVINVLESHGMDRCPDKGPVNFERYASMKICTSDIHRIGAIIRARELKEMHRKKKAS